MSNIQEKLKKGQNLSFDESKVLFSELMEGKHDEKQLKITSRNINYKKLDKLTGNTTSYQSGFDLSCSV